MKQLLYTPWGSAQQQESIGDAGLIQVSTSSHGGIFVPQELYDAMPAGLRCNPYGGGTWFEEDCEWALVALAFPQWFDARSLHAAVRTVDWCKGEDTYYRAYRWLHDTEQGRALLVNHWAEPAKEVA